MDMPITHIEIVDNQARISGTNVKVKAVVNMHLRGGASFPEVIEQYQISPAQIHAALSYYYDNQAEFDRQYQEGQTLLEQYGTPADELGKIIRDRKSS